MSPVNPGLHLANDTNTDWQTVKSLGVRHYVDLDLFQSRWASIMKDQPDAHLHVRCFIGLPLGDPRVRAAEFISLAQKCPFVSTWRMFNEPDIENLCNPYQWYQWHLEFGDEVKRSKIPVKLYIAAAGGSLNSESYISSSAQAVRESGVYYGIDLHAYGNPSEVESRCALLRKHWSGRSIITEHNFGSGRTYNLNLYANDWPRVLQIAAKYGIEAVCVFIWKWYRPDPNVKTTVNVSGTPLQQVIGRNIPMSLFDDWVAAGGVRDNFISHLKALGKPDFAHPDLYGLPINLEPTVIPPVIPTIPFKNPKPFRLAISAGHHNLDGGNPVEYGLTGQLTASLAGIAKVQNNDVAVITPNNGLGKYNGSVYDVAHQVVDLDYTKPVDFYIEWHTNAGPRGVFCVYPDWGSDVDTDVRDKLGPEIAKAISNATGIPIYNNGIMSEKQTDVGGQGYRLGIFSATAGMKDHLTRILIECGAHTQPQDLAILQSSGTFNKIATATVDALTKFHS